MTTITIKNDALNFPKKKFNNLAELQDYLSLWINTNNELSDTYKKQLDLREKELLLAKEDGVSWEVLKKNLKSKINGV